MKLNISHIIEGWANVVKDKFNALDPATKDLAARRIQHCDVCYLRTGNKCDPSRKGMNLKTGKIEKGCGCNIAAKALSKHSKCPLDKW
jgi:hypothetical protein